MKVRKGICVVLDLFSFSRLFKINNCCWVLGKEEHDPRPHSQTRQTAKQQPSPAPAPAQIPEATQKSLVSFVGKMKAGRQNDCF